MKQRAYAEMLRLLGIKNATVLTYMTICFNGLLTQGPCREFTSMEQMKPLVKALLDAGIPVDVHWSDMDYSVLDKRLRGPLPDLGGKVVKILGTANAKPKSLKRPAGRTKK